MMSELRPRHTKKTILFREDLDPEPDSDPDPDLDPDPVPDPKWQRKSKRVSLFPFATFEIPIGTIAVKSKYRTNK